MSVSPSLSLTPQPLFRIYKMKQVNKHKYNVTASQRLYTHIQAKTCKHTLTHTHTHACMEHRDQFSISRVLGIESWHRAVCISSTAARAKALNTDLVTYETDALLHLRYPLSEHRKQLRHCGLRVQQNLPALWVIGVKEGKFCNRK